MLLFDHDQQRTLAGLMLIFAVFLDFSGNPQLAWLPGHFSKHKAVPPLTDSVSTV